MIVFIWKGKGWLVFVVTAVIFVGISALTEVLFNEKDYYETHAWVSILSFLIVSGILYLTVRYLQFNPQTPSSRFDGLFQRFNTLFGLTSNEGVSYDKWDHTCFFVPMEYYWIIMLGYALVQPFFY
jgi:hypothetical protein